MGVDFPDSLRASLLRHNGSRGTGAFGFGAWFDGAVNLGIRDIQRRNQYNVVFLDAELAAREEISARAAGVLRPPRNP